MWNISFQDVLFYETNTGELGMEPYHPILLWIILLQHQTLSHFIPYIILTNS